MMASVRKNLREDLQPRKKHLLGKVNSFSVNRLI